MTNSMGDFPWNLLKIETLRLSCRDLGFKALRRDVMIQFLTTVEQDGREYSSSGTTAQLIIEFLKNKNKKKSKKP